MGILEKCKARLREIVVLAAVTMFVIAPFVSIMHRTSEPAFIASDESPIEGTAGYTIYREECPQQTSVVVYNGTVNDPSADWCIVYEEFCHSYDESRGVRLELDGVSTYPGGYYTVDSHVRFVGTPTLPLFNYSQVSFSVDIRVLQGSANASLGVGYVVWPGYYWDEGGENRTHIEENQSAELRLNPSLSGAFNLSSGWIVRTTVFVEVASSEKSLVLIGDVVISVDSNENLFPATFDIQATDGESLFLNPYMRSLRYGYSFYHEDQACYPGVRLTRTGNTTDSSIFGPRIINETLYLAEGKYEGTTGWFYEYGSSLDSKFNISFTVGSDESILVVIRIPTLRLYVDIHPSFAYSRVSVRDGVVSYVVDYPLQNAEYLYMPNRTSFAVYVMPLVYESHRFVDYAHYNYRQATAVFGAYTNGTSNVRVTVVFSQFSVFGVILDWGQILGILATALLLVLLIHGAAKRSFAGVVKDYNLRTNLLPVSLYYIAVFLPWVTYNFDTNADPFSSVSGAVMVPLFTTLWWTPQSQLTPAPSSYLLPNVIVIGGLYWMPMIYLSYLIATRKDSISYELSIDRTDPLLSLGVIGGPFIVGCYYAWLCMTGICYVSIGLVAALSTLPSWGVAAWLRRRHNVSHAANFNFRESSSHVPLK